MMTADRTISVADWSIDSDELRQIRSQVFIEEQHVPVELEWDEFDESCTHFIVREGTAAIATARLKTDGQIGRMAVLVPYRNQGIGSNLLRFILKHAASSGFTSVFLHAQSQVVSFYQHHGFETEGENFLDAGIVHRAMSRKIG